MPTSRGPLRKVVLAFESNCDNVSKHEYAGTSMVPLRVSHLINKEICQRTNHDIVIHHARTQRQSSSAYYQCPLTSPVSCWPGSTMVLWAIVWVRWHSTDRSIIRHRIWSREFWLSSRFSHYATMHAQYWRDMQLPRRRYSYSCFWR